MIRAFFATLALIAVTSNAIALDSDESVAALKAKYEKMAEPEPAPVLDGAKGHKGVSAGIAARSAAF